MKREIKFRGWSEELNRWVYGGYYISVMGEVVIEGTSFYEVVPESVGMFTGVIGEDGVEIYEGDRLVAANGCITEVSFGKWDFDYDSYHGGVDSVNGIGFYFSDGEPFSESFGRNYRVIGNVFIDKED